MKLTVDYGVLVGLDAADHFYSNTGDFIKLDQFDGVMNDVAKKLENVIAELANALNDNKDKSHPLHDFNINKSITYSYELDGLIGLNHRVNIAFDIATDKDGELSARQQDVKNYLDGVLSSNGLNYIDATVQLTPEQAAVYKQDSFSLRFKITDEDELTNGLSLVSNNDPIKVICRYNVVDLENHAELIDDELGRQLLEFAVMSTADGLRSRLSDIAAQLASSLNSNGTNDPLYGTNLRSTEFWNIDFGHTDGFGFNVSFTFDFRRAKEGQPTSDTLDEAEIQEYVDQLICENDFGTIRLIIPLPGYVSDYEQDQFTFNLYLKKN